MGLRRETRLTNGGGRPLEILERQACRRTLHSFDATRTGCRNLLGNMSAGIGELRTFGTPAEPARDGAKF